MSVTWVLQTNKQDFLDDCRKFQIYGVSEPEFKSLQQLNEGDTVFLRLQLKNEKPEYAYLGPYKATANQKPWVESIKERHGIWQKLGEGANKGPRWLSYFPWCVFLDPTADFIDDLRALNISRTINACEPIASPMGEEIARKLVQTDYLPQSNADGYRTTRGVWVRSRAEYMIDNWFTEHGIVTYYEKAIYLESHKITPDWYIPTINTYIEYLGLTGDEKYMQTWSLKESMYQKCSIKYITLRDDDLTDLDLSIPSKLPQLRSMGLLR